MSPRARRLLVALTALCFLLVVAAIAAWAWKHRERAAPKVVGSPSVEFVTTAAPKTEQRPKKLIRDEPWPTYGYSPERTHAAFYRLRPPFHIVWRRRLHYQIEYPPVVAYGRLFVGQFAGRFYSIDVRTGKLRWRRKLHHCQAASPTVSHGIVYQAYMQPQPCDKSNRPTQGGFVAAWTAARGHQVWIHHGGVVESSPLVVDGTIYFGSKDGNVYALNAGNGRVRWTYQTGNQVTSSPAYANGTIYIGNNSAHLFALNARTGRLKWRASGREYFYATPTVAYGRVYLGDTSGTLYSFGARTGRIRWAQPAGTYVYSAAAVWNKTVYVGSYDGNFYAFDAATGRRRWTFSTPSAIHGAPTVLNGLVYFSSCGSCGAGGSRYAKQGPRRTFALDARTGRKVWEFPDGKYSPVVADSQHVYLVGKTRLYALVPCSDIRRARRKRRQLPGLC